MTQTASSPQNWPKTALELLKARYQAFVDGDVDFVMNTHHPETRNQVDPLAVASWSKNSRWKGLEVHEVKEAAETCHIHFTASYEKKQEIIPHSEFAEFRKHEGRWHYYDSEFPKLETFRRSEQKAGRNDPCPCGSGKKFKKCHALQAS
jgi:SEC-C motif-containing protein